MDVLDIARWQFGIITVYHFLFVPLTIGLTAVIAGLETAWVRTGKEDYLRLTKFFGLWIFGWDKLPRALHAGCMWLVHLGTLASSWFILAANSWMQHPVGYRFNPE